MTSTKKLDTYAQITWCPGCGNFGILSALKRALTDLEAEGIDTGKIVVASGIGCHAKIVDYLNVNTFYSIHGRVPPAISGIKLANPELTVIGHSGDGDAYGEGISHLIFSAKRNININMIVHNNRVYGLTTGQFTPTSPTGFRGKSTPEGSPEEPLNPVELMLSAGATFVARGYSARIGHLSNLIKEAVHHNGFSFIDVLQPCHTFFNTYDLYNEKTYELTEENHDPSDFDRAMTKARQWPYETGERIPIGIFYRTEKPTYEDRLLKGRVPVKMNPRDVKTILESHI